MPLWILCHLGHKLRIADDRNILYQLILRQEKNLKCNFLIGCSERTLLHEVDTFVSCVILRKQCWRFLKSKYWKYYEPANYIESKVQMVCCLPLMSIVWNKFPLSDTCLTVSVVALLDGDGEITIVGTKLPSCHKSCCWSSKLFIFIYAWLLF